MKTKSNELAMEWFEIRQRRLTLDREARELEKAEKELAAKLLKKVEAAKRPIKLTPNTMVTIKYFRKAVSWAKEFERLLGKDAAEELRLAQPEEPRLEIVSVE